MRSPTTPRRLAAGVLCMSVLAPAAAGPARPDTEAQARARAIMMKMAQFLAGAPRFRVSMDAAYDSVQGSGQKIEFHEDRTVTLNRPDRLRVEGTRADGAQVLTVFTGKDVVVVDHAGKVYATAPQPGTLDETIVYFVRDLGMRLPLAAMLLGRLPAELEERLPAVDYVGLARLHGKPVHHIAARGATVDVQMWVAEGAQPLPQRVVLTYKQERGQPQFRADFSKWNLAPEITDATFAAPAAAGLQKVAFATRVPRAPAKGAK